MKTEIDDVQRFLNELRVKMRVFGILYRDDRGKNAQTLADLEIAPNKRKEIIEELTTEDYHDGPREEKLYGMLPLWIFGKTVRKHEIYIKITLGHPDNPAICISFHKAEHPIKHPFKNNQS